MIRGRTTGAVAALLLAAASGAALAQDAPRGDPTSFASATEIEAAVAAMKAGMKPDQHFAYRPLLRDGDQVAALEYWTGPGMTAVHPIDAEYVVVIAGAGTLVSGGTMPDPVVRNPHQIDGGPIAGGTTRRLAPGDAFLIPAGVPHWFGITGERLVLLGTKLPQK